jgi:GTP pyrophosphokinase
VFTPDVEMIELPAGSTPLDFAYQIHTRVGDEARSARINGVLRPLSTPLRDGDQVHIIRLEGEQPLREWLDKDLGFVHTAYARNKIRRVFLRLDGDEAVSVGWEPLRREMKMMGLEDYDLDTIAKELGCEGVDQLLRAIARADLMPHEVAHLAMERVWNALEATPAGGVVLSPDGPVTVRGVPGRPVRLCGTCEPVVGDPIVGNLLRGGQVTVHRMDCHQIAHTTRQAIRLNLVEVNWAKEPRTTRPIHVCVAAVDRSGLTHDMTRILELEHVNICELYGRSDHAHHVGLVTMTIEVASLRQLSRILHRFAQLPNVKAVQRVCDPPHCQGEALQWAIESVQSTS